MTPPTIPSPELGPVLERLRVRLLEVPRGALYDTGQAAPLWVAASFDEKGVRSEPVAFATRWKDAATFAEALENGSLEVLECALWLVEALDRGCALEEALAIRALPPPMLGFGDERQKVGHFESLVRDRALHVVSRCVDSLPAATVVELAQRGDVLLPVAEAPLTKHPGLQEGEAILAALQKTTMVASDLWNASPSPPDADLTRFLMRRLVDLRYEPAVAVLGLRLGTGLLQIGSPAALELLAQGVEEGVFDAPDPNLPTRETALRGLFLLDPERAWDRLSRYLDQSAITAETAGAMMLAVVQVLWLDHRTRAGSGGPTFFEADPRWAALVDRMAQKDPDWGRVAWTFQDLSLEEVDRKVRAWERRHARRRPTAKV